MNRSLSIAFTASDVERLIDQHRDDTMLAMDAEAWMHASDRGVPVMTPSELCAAGYHTIARVNDECHGLWRMHARVEHAGFNVLDLVAYRHRRWIGRFSYVAACVGAAIDRLRPQSLRLCGHGGGHGLDPAVGTRRMPALLDVARHAAASLGTACHQIDNDDHVLKSSTRCESRVVAAPPVEAGHVLMVAGPTERARCEALAMQLRESASTPAVVAVHGSSDPDPTQTQSYVLSDESYAGPCIPVPLDCTSVRARLSDAVSRASFGAQQAMAGLSEASHFDFLFGEYAARMAGHALRWCRTLTSCRPRAVVAMYPCVAIEVAANLGIPTVMLPHGPMMISEDAYFELLPRQTFIGAVGDLHRMRLCENQINPSRIAITGVESGRSTPRRKPLLQAAPAHITIVTSDTACPAHLGAPPPVAFEREAAAIRELAMLCAQRGMAATIRRHPRYDRSPAFYRNLIGPYGKSVHVAEIGVESLAEAAERSAAVVCCGAPGSSLLEAAAWSPAAVVTRAWIDPRDAETWAVTHLRVVESPAALLDLIALWIDQPDVWKQARLQAREASNRLLFRDDGSAAIALIEHALGSRVTQAA